MKKVLTFTIIAGSRACPNDCLPCISKMTPSHGIGLEKPEVDWEKFMEASRIALNYGAENVLITSKGEATCFPEQISQYLINLNDAEKKFKKSFVRKELQTEGSLLAKGGLYDNFLDEWPTYELRTIAVSMYHPEEEKNREVFRPKSGKSYDLPNLIRKLHSKGFNTRLSCVLLDGYVDSVEEVKNLIGFAKRYDVPQLTVRRADRPENPLDAEAAAYVDKHRLSDERFAAIGDYLKENGSVYAVYPHGAVVYKSDGQYICITTGLTNDTGKDEIRQLIYFPPGRLATNWEKPEEGRIM